MLSPFSCGFSQPETTDEFNEPIITNSPSSTPRRSLCRKSGASFIHRIHNSNNNKDKNNPYSSRGLDKFSALVAELEEKRKEIYAKTGSENDTFVRFVYKDNNDNVVDNNDNVPVPIVLKLKDKKQEENQHKVKKCNKPNNAKEGLAEKTVMPFVTQAKEEVALVVEQQLNKTNIVKKSKVSGFWSGVNFRRPSFYFPVVVVLILVLLAVFGRSVAILCTSIGWYGIPTLKEQSAKSKRRSLKTKTHVKRSSENKMVKGASESSTSPKSEGISTPRSKHDHRKSW